MATGEREERQLKMRKEQTDPDQEVKTKRVVMDEAKAGEGTRNAGLAADELPVASYREEVIGKMQCNSVMVVVGETGSGKTTQLGQMVLDEGLGGGKKVAVTQPRRVAAVTVAKRVAQERRATIGKEVGYTVRFEDQTATETALKFVTDGSLLRELLDDPELRQYGAIILDEAHERSLATDILFGICKRLAKTRDPPLKLAVTSATLDGDKFSRYFYSAPVIDIPGRAYPVDIAHATEQPKHHFQAALDATMMVHCKEGVPGDILVFMPGQEEIERLVAKLNDAVASLSEEECPDAQILPLYAALPPEMQARVFSDPPEGLRRIVVATNLAETSVTVPGIVYVIDPGKTKRKDYDADTGMESLAVCDVSQTEAIQRAGRAGRIKPGKCFRLYTKQHFEEKLEKSAKPEIQRSSLAGTVLHLKSLSLGIDILSFDFLDPPPRSSLEDALRQLYILDAIDADGNVTALGMEMSRLPLDPPLARALLAAMNFDCVEEMCTVAGMLSADRIFYAAGKADEHSVPDWSRVCDSDEICYGDHVLFLRLFQAYERARNRNAFCHEYNLNPKGMDFASHVKAQLLAIGEKAQGQHQSSQGMDGNDKHMKKRKRNEASEARSKGGQFGSPMHAMRAALCVGYAGKLARRMPNHNGYRTYNEASVLVSVHPSSEKLLFDEEGLLPEWLIYHELVTTSRPYMRHVCAGITPMVCAVESAWVQPLLLKLRSIDVKRLSKASEDSGDGNGKEEVGVRAQLSEGDGSREGHKGKRLSAGPKKNDTDIEEARRRYLERKAGRGKPSRPTR